MKISSYESKSAICWKKKKFSILRETLIKKKLIFLAIRTQQNILVRRAILQVNIEVRSKYEWRKIDKPIDWYNFEGIEKKKRKFKKSASWSRTRIGPTLRFAANECSAVVEIHRNLLLSLLVCSLPEDNARGNDLGRAYTERKDCVHKLSRR